MITEVARIEIDPANTAAFEQAVAEAAPHFRAAPGCRSFRLDRSVDSPGQYQLVVGWDSVDAHMVDFRASAGFAAWRALASPYFRTPPQVDHVEPAVEGF
ncbi:antibiotic biosynthesis monooxygenase family protein [Sphingobium sp. CAP-1]|uniref:antibiotic biosynthesis monooxygenase family protein n=1 Tax=Sphingobium sp. CAP-1 TaxID=2676077 RepID=UPI0012BB1E41|nr:antibiotic biosynthesis monooxygenase [Sphingobium sp. CAP-1]QGP78075.1 antibiotic biosynthesis monooxygenase [Sphingobium sp. CAP-1]